MVGFLLSAAARSCKIEVAKGGRKWHSHSCIIGNITKSSVPIIFIASLVTIALRLPVMSGGTNSRFGLYIVVVDH